MARQHGLYAVARPLAPGLCRTEVPPRRGLEGRGKEEGVSPGSVELQLPLQLHNGLSERYGALNRSTFPDLSG